MKLLIGTNEFECLSYSEQAESHLKLFILPNTSTVEEIAILIQNNSVIKIMNNEEVIALYNNYNQVITMQKIFNYPYSGEEVAAMDIEITSPKFAQKIDNLEVSLAAAETRVNELNEAIIITNTALYKTADDLDATEDALDTLIMKDDE